MNKSNENDIFYLKLERFFSRFISLQNIFCFIKYDNFQETKSIVCSQSDGKFTPPKKLLTWFRLCFNFYINFYSYLQPLISHGRLFKRQLELKLSTDRIQTQVVFLKRRSVSRDPRFDLKRLANESSTRFGQILSHLR